MIQAIETAYNNYWFRSRLEARWAVFFDALNVQYHYEPEGYRLKDGSWYLPDFKLYNVDLRERKGPLWAEIKPDVPSDAEETKLGLLVDATETSGVILIGAPWDHLRLPRAHDGHYEYSYRPENKGTFNPDINWFGCGGTVIWDNNMVFCKCYNCGAMKFDFWDSNNLVCDRCEGKSNPNHPVILRAEKRAKQARFGA